MEFDLFGERRSGHRVRGVGSAKGEVVESYESSVGGSRKFVCSSWSFSVIPSAFISDKTARSIPVTLL
jgi:hypothetical protein